MIKKKINFMLKIYTKQNNKLFNFLDYNFFFILMKTV